MADDNGAFSAVESLLGDRYTREARLAPAFLSLFPVLLVLIISFKGLRDTIPALLSLLCVFGVVRWISHIARGIGDKKEIKLFRDWKGKPTTTMLRFALGYLSNSDAAHYGEQVMHLLLEAPPADKIQQEIAQRAGPPLPAAQKDAKIAQYLAFPVVKPALLARIAAAFKKIAAAVAGKMPATASDALDHLYEPTVAWMRENSRESVLVIEEEISYGFQRNFFALRRFVFLCAVASFIVEARTAHLQVQFAWPIAAHSIIAHIDTPIAAVILTALAGYLICLLWFVNENSVMVQGFIYARALLDSFYAEGSSTKPDPKHAPEQPS